MHSFEIDASKEIITFVFYSKTRGSKFFNLLSIVYLQIITMVSGDTNIILEKLQQYPGVEVKPHFEKLSLRWKNKIWITWKEGDSSICLKLSLEDQEVFCRMSKGSVYPVPNKWGGHGWTNVNYGHVDQALLSDILMQSIALLDAKSDHSSFVSFLHQIHES